MHALLVADGATRLPAIHQVLASRGHVVTSAGSLASALAMQKSAPADILVMDWSGTTQADRPLSEALLQTTRDSESAVLAIVHPDSSELEEALDAGVNDYLSLPLAPRAVEARIAVVERWLDQVRAHRGSHGPGQAALPQQSLRDADFRAILDACPEPICIHRQRTIVYANPALASSLQVGSVADVVGGRVADIVHPDDRAAVEERLAGIERTGKPAALREERFVARDGSLRVGEAHSFLIQMDDGPAIVSLGRDLTERRALEAQFRHSERLASVGAIAASVAHELNNPLTLVLCNLTDLERNLPPLAEHVPERMVLHLERRVHAIEEAASQMRALARDLTDFVRAKEAATQRVPLKPLLERAVRMIGAYAKDRSVLVFGQLEEAGEVEGSETRLLQVFLNLLINAVDAAAKIPPGQERRVAVSLRREEDSAVAVVADSGAGVPVELRTRIFEPFFSTKAAGQGTGLGLAVAKSIVDSLRGSILVLDRPGGASFEVRLPAAS
jgi:two-component system NtrC family sensor kinase